MPYVDNERRSRFGHIIKQRRISLSLSLREVAEKSGVSAAHLRRVEKGERFPSTHVLRKIAQPLFFQEDELFNLAGYLTLQPSAPAEKMVTDSEHRLDPLVARVLAQELVEVQRVAYALAIIIKGLARNSVTKLIL